MKKLKPTKLTIALLTIVHLGMGSLTTANAKDVTNNFVISVNQEEVTHTKKEKLKKFSKKVFNDLNKGEVKDIKNTNQKVLVEIAENKLETQRAKEKAEREAKERAIREAQEKAQREEEERQRAVMEKAHQEALANGKSFSINGSRSEFKAWEDYKMITSPSSPQYKLQQQATTDEYGLRRYQDCYMVALGSFYGSHIGDHYQVTFADGQSIEVVLGDQKADRDTDEQTHSYCSNGHVIEFIVDKDNLKSEYRRSGSVDLFKGKITSIKKL